MLRVHAYAIFAANYCRTNHNLRAFVDVDCICIIHLYTLYKCARAIIILKRLSVNVRPIQLSLDYREKGKDKNLRVSGRIRLVQC